MVTDSSHFRMQVTDAHLFETQTYYFSKNDKRLITDQSGKNQLVCPEGHWIGGSTRNHHCLFVSCMFIVLNSDNLIY